MSLTLARITARIANDKLTPEERLKAIEKLDEVDIIETERRFLLLSRLIKDELKKVLSLEGEAKEIEKNVFVNLLRTLGVISEKSDVVSEKFTNTLLEVLTKEFDKLPKNLIIEMLRSSKWALRKNPWKIFDFSPFINKLLQSYLDDVSIIKAVLEFIGEVSWEVPYIIYDFEEKLREWLKSDNEEIRESVIDTLMKAGKRSFYAVKSFLEEILEMPELLRDEKVLIFLTSTPIPSNRLDLAQKIIDVLESEFLSPGSPKDKKILGITQWAFLVRRGELKDLQQSFLERIIAELNIEIDNDVRQALINASVIPAWHMSIDLTELVDLLTDIIRNPAEDDKIRISAIQGLTHIVALRYKYADDFANALIQALEEAHLTPELKENILNAMDFIIRIVRHPEIIRRINAQLIRTMTDVTERTHYLLINAAKILISSAKRYPDIMAEFLPELKSHFLSITDWSIRDSIVRIAGETLRRLGDIEENGIDIIIDALKDDLIFQVALEYFHYLSFKYPEKLAKYITQLYDFIDMLRDLESSILQEQKIEEYYAYIETPLRYFIKSVLNIALSSPQAIKEAVDLLIHTLRSEKNEIIIRDFIDIFDQIIAKYPEMREYIASQELPDNVKQILSKYGFRL